MNLGPTEAAYNAMEQLKDECRKYNGDFSVLWHNTRLQFKAESILFQKCLQFGA